MLEKQLRLDETSIGQLMEQLKSGVPYIEYEFKKHRIILKNDTYDEIGYVRLPLRYFLYDTFEIVNENAIVLYLTIESGSAAICVMKGEENVFHTTFGAYMTRKKQGVSQIKYLNKKGKSRAGSRVRLASTLQFFENINTSLTELFEAFHIERIALSCSPTLIPYLHKSKTFCPFAKKDWRLYKIPLHLPQSNYTNLTEAIKKLSTPRLFYNEQYQSQLPKLVEGHQ